EPVVVINGSPTPTPSPPPTTAAAAADPVVVETMNSFKDARWVGGTWDLKQFGKDGQTNWDAVIDAAEEEEDSPGTEINGRYTVVSDLVASGMSSRIALSVLQIWEATTKRGVFD
ncbi:hypothetical protein MIMGU_mgv1a024517mg, partial [Erythranthe guttata]